MALTPLDDSVLKYHYRQMEEQTGNLTSRVAIATKINLLILPPVTLFLTDTQVTSHIIMTSWQATQMTHTTCQE